MSVTWRKTLKRILEAADQSQAKLAKEVHGLYPMALTRYLREPGTDGAYSPEKPKVRAINRAAAKLTGLPEIEGYLTLLAMLDDLLPRKDDDLSFDALRELAAEFDPYFDDDPLPVIEAAWQKLDDRERRGILAGLTAHRGLELIQRLEGRPPRAWSLSVFLQVFSDAGIPLVGSLRADEALIRRLARERFEAQAIAAIASLNGHSGARIESARAIMQSFDEALNLALSEDAAELRELTLHKKRIKDFLRRFRDKRSLRRPSGFAYSLAIVPEKDKRR